MNLINKGRANESKLTQEHLKSLFYYDPLTGLLTNKQKRANSTKIGKVAGRVNTKGYVQVSIKGVAYSAHRIIWCYVYGCFPEEQIDHINRNRSDNRLANLRCVTASQNQHNTGLRKDNKTGVTGVRWRAAKKNYEAKINIRKKRHYLGSYDNLFDAACARKSAELKYSI